MMENRLPGRLPALDGLRGVAILMVISAHGADGWQRALLAFRDDVGAQPLLLPRWLHLVAADGAYGVELFFIVSAFTLTAGWLRGRTALGAYAVRRVLRIGPAYWIAGCAYTAAGLVTVGGPPLLFAPHGTGPLDWVTAALFASAWLGGASLAVVPGGWSVSCEATFYLALPLLLFAVNRSRGRAMVLVAISLLTAQVFARRVILAHGFDNAAFFNPLAHAPLFALGIAGAICAWAAAPRRIPGAFDLLLLVLAIFVLPLETSGDRVLMPHLRFGVVAAVAVTLAALSPSALLENRLLRKIGEVSYSMYLIHFAVLPASLWAAEQVFPRDDAWTFLVHVTLTTAVTFAVSCVTYRYVETPFVNWSHTALAPRPRAQDADATTPSAPG